ncbi:hypothetical protein CEE37_04395 [candidate division LCP-89 bacterium B3_LCP]|uniref:HAD family hydrolase n=1 Tax=candidate division LCP-89 bacterium B3_LCP TaxID=2012998 RepID=A0A532V3M1_UNCL8|nr:MAG: hypothetical protein CEE37_04395 [candidate division LCP-89 bacterium B3_LCP]
MIDRQDRLIKAILFDMDGVLIDSMPHHVSAWQQVFSEFGVEIPARILQEKEGEKARITMLRLAKENGLDWDEDCIDELIDKKRSIYRKNAPRGLRTAAKEVLQFCNDRNLKTAIVTGSVRRNLEWTLSEEERSLFDVIISSELYSESKPHPRPFLRAADELQVPPPNCLVIENAPLGIKSANAAKMTCMAITTTLPEDELRGADYIRPDVNFLPEIIDIIEKQ